MSDVFLRDLGRRFATPPGELTRDAREALLRYDWPGNVRELHNALERAAILCEGQPIAAEHLRLSGGAAAAVPPAAAPTTDLNEVERDLIVRVLHECHGNKSLAASRLGLSRTQLYVRLRRYQIVAR